MINPIRHARAEDARDLAQLINIAGEGMAMYMWGQSATANQTPLDFGTDKAQNPSGGFSYRNAWVWEEQNTLMGMLLAYPLDDPYLVENIYSFPETIRPLIQLEAEAPGSYYINGLAAYPEFRGRGIGQALLELADSKAPEFGCSELSLIVANGNDSAISLYKRCGYRDHAARDIAHFPGAPSHSNRWLLMKKALAN